jgi:hypothetical protein
MEKPNVPYKEDALHSVSPPSPYDPHHHYCTLEAEASVDAVLLFLFLFFTGLLD